MKIDRLALPSSVTSDGKTFLFVAIYCIANDLGFDSLNTIVVNEKIDGSEPCWDGYQVEAMMQRHRSMDTRLPLSLLLESSVLSIEFPRHGFNWNDIEMGRSILGGGSTELLFVRWWTSSTRESPSFISGNTSFAWLNSITLVRNQSPWRILLVFFLLRRSSAQVFDLTWSLVTSDAEWNFVFHLSRREVRAALTLEKSVDRSIQSLQIFILTFLRSSLRTINTSLLDLETTSWPSYASLEYSRAIFDARSAMTSRSTAVSFSSLALKRKADELLTLITKKKCDDTKTSTDRPITYQADSKHSTQS